MISKHLKEKISFHLVTLHRVRLHLVTILDMRLRTRLPAVTLRIGIYRFESIYLHFSPSFILKQFFELTGR